MDKQYRKGGRLFCTKYEWGDKNGGIKAEQSVVTANSLLDSLYFSFGVSVQEPELTGEKARGDLTSPSHLDLVTKQGLRWQNSHYSVNAFDELSINLYIQVLEHGTNSYIVLDQHWLNLFFQNIHKSNIKLLQFQQSLMLLIGS